MRTLLRLLLATAIVLGALAAIAAACWLEIFGVPVILILVFGLGASIPIAMVYDALEFDFYRKNRQ